MTIYEVNKIMSSENKSKLIARFWDCTCQNYDVTQIKDELHISQSNLSKHLVALLKLGVLNCKQVGNTRFYFLNKKWKEKWAIVVEPQIKLMPNNEFVCSHSC